MRIAAGVNPALADRDLSTLDSNASERSLRRVALGRKNYLFVGDVEAGKSIAGLYTLVSTCEARGINPFAYLADVIPRVQDHPKRRLDDLLPGPWARARVDAQPTSLIARLPPSL